MDTYLPELISGSLLLLIGPRKALLNSLPRLTARMSSRRKFRVLDCGNSFRAHLTAREIQMNGDHLNSGLNNISLARAFTCYQVHSLLCNTPRDGAPCLAVDLLSTFNDENIAQPERERVLQRCMEQLTLLSQTQPVAIVAFSVPEQPENVLWLKMLKSIAGRTWLVEDPPRYTQLSFA